MSGPGWLRTAGRAAVPIAAVALVFVVWGVLVRVLDVPPYVVPSPGATLDTLREDWPRLWGLTLTTTKECVIGFVAGAAVGFLLAVAMAQVRTIQRIAYPILIASQAIPIVAIAAPLVLVLGFGLAPKIVIVALIVFFPVVVNTLDGLNSVDRDLLNLARAMDGSPLRVFLHIRLPATFTPLFSALKIGATYTVTGAVLGEWTATAGRGLGNYLLEQNARLNTAAVYGAVLLLTAIGIAGFLLISALERLATPWRTRSTARRVVRLRRHDTGRER